MLKKFITIKQVGRFVNCDAPGDLELRKLTVIHADNGRGKSTLSSILRSLQTGDPAYISGRSSLGTSGAPHVVIRLEGESRTFEHGAWDQPYPDLLIFDDTFINDNVYTGDYIAHEHRKNLYQVIIGSRGVVLANRVDELDSEIRESNRDLTIKENAVGNHRPPSMTTGEFLALPPDAQIDEKISAKTAELQAAEQASTIKAKPPLELLTLPTLTADLDTLLGRSLPDIQHDAEQRVREHTRRHQDSGFEQWLSQGVTYVSGLDCPFCGQSLTGNQLLKAYQAYFAQSYKDLKAALGTLRANVDQMFSDASGLRIQQRVTENARLMDFWGAFISTELPEPETVALQAAIRAVRTAALSIIDQKIATPLEPLQQTPELRAAQAQLALASDNIARYNDAVRAVNEKIVATKDAMLTADAAMIKNELARLRVIKTRHTEPGITACIECNAAFERKAILELRKVNAKQELDDYAKTVFEQYQDRINQLLDQFGAGFRISDVKTRYAGGTPSSSFQIIINNMAVDLGDAKSPLSTPSFRNTLSAGDRRSLALAFFIAQAERDPELPKKTIVFDDPFNSLDGARRTCTNEQIYKLLSLAKQVIVLSHDPYFLRLVHDRVPGACVKTLELTRDGGSTTIREWDIEAATREEYFQNYDTVNEYVMTGAGDSVHVVRCIRLLLEKYLRIKYPTAFLPNEWLGDFIHKIRLAPTGSVLARAQHLFAELEAINEYSKRYHHATEHSVVSGPINESELTTYARRTVDLIANT